MTLEGLRVAVTGAARDTGRLLAEIFPDRGAHVFLSARDIAAAEHVAAAINRRGRGRATAFACDLTVPASIRAFTDSLAGRTPHLDVLVNNGAVYIEGNDLADASDDEMETMMAAGVTGAMVVTKHVLPLLRASPRSSRTGSAPRASG